MHSSLWSAEVSPTPSRLISIDEGGRLWYQTDGQTPTPIYPDIRFTAGTAADWVYDTMAIFLLGDLSPDTGATTVAQLPQSGDPAASWRQQVMMLLGIAALAGAAIICRSARKQSI